jgi:hypothetical protein
MFVAKHAFGTEEWLWSSGMTKMFNTFLASLLHHGPATSRLDYVTFK